MASPVTEDQDQRNNAGLEDLTPLTIESLRARLLSERALSKSSKQRADELARRVSELEEQLRIVSLQRKKAEKATADVLAILESNGISDASDAYDSYSDQETISDDTMKVKGTSSNFEVRRRDMEAYSSSEIDSSPSTGRSLSWKSCKDSNHSLQKTKYMENVRRRSSTFSSNSTFPKRIGKSCRRIRRRESRSVAEQMQNDAKMQGSAVDTFSKESPSSVNIEHSVNQGVNDAMETSVSGSPGNRVDKSYCSDRDTKNEDVDGTLESQAHFRGPYEADEKAHREWEEKVRENSSSVLDSCDPGNRSDVTEERDDMKATDHLSPEATINTEKRGSNLELVKSSSNEQAELKVAKNMVVPSSTDGMHLQDQKTSSLGASETSLLDFTRSTSKGNQSQVFSGNLGRTSPPSSHISSISNGSVGILSSHGPSVSSKDGESSGTRKELALIPQKPSNNLDSVLEALQRAKLSLNHKLQGMSPSEIGSSVKSDELSVPGIRAGEKVEIMGGFSGLFRLPTDYQSESTSKVNNLGSNSASTLALGYHEAATERFLGSPYEERRSSALLGNQFYGNSPTEIRPELQSATPTATFPQNASGMHASAMPYMERQPGMFSSRAVYDNSFDTGLPSSSTRFSDIHPRTNPGLIPGGLHDSAMPLMEMQPDIRGTKPVYENTYDASPSSSGRSSYVDPQMNLGLVLPSRYTQLTYPFYPEMPHEVPSSNDRLPRNVPSNEYGMPSASGFSFYDDHFRPNA